MIKVLIADDYPTLRTGTETLLKEAGIEVILAQNSEDMIHAAKDSTIDIFLLNFFMQEGDRIDSAKKILEFNPDIKIIVFTGLKIDIYFNLLVSAGVSGFITEAASPTQLINAINGVLKEEVILPLSLLRQLRRNLVLPNENCEKGTETVTLTAKEQKILKLISKGYTNKKIAEELYVSQRTVEYHLTKIYSKLKVRSRFEAIQSVRKYGLHPELMLLNEAQTIVF